MSTRNPNNDRYKTEEHIGQTRKSAASAKPKRKAAESVYIPEAPKKLTQKEKAAKSVIGEVKTDDQKKREKEEKRRRREEQNIRLEMLGPITDPKFKRNRIIWWAAIVLAILCTIASFIMRQVMPDGGSLDNTAAVVVLGGAYVSIVFALIFDGAAIRPMRTAQRQLVAKPMTKKERKEFDDYVAMKAAAQAAGESKGLVGDITDKIKGLFGGTKNKTKVQEVADQIEQEKAALESKETKSL